MDPVAHFTIRDLTKIETRDKSKGDFIKPSYQHRGNISRNYRRPSYGSKPDYRDWKEPRTRKGAWDDRDESQHCRCDRRNDSNRTNYPKVTRLRGARYASTVDDTYDHKRHGERHN